MASGDRSLRILSYNIHKGFGPGNWSFTLHRLARALREIDADIVFLQEVVGRHDRHAVRFGDWPIAGQLEAIAEAHWAHHAYGRNAVYDAGHHGNAILSRFPILEWSNHDISQHAVENRGVLACTVDFPVAGKPLRCFCVHFGLLRRWRTRQAQSLCELVIAHTRTNEAVIIGGDFNDWRDHLTGVLEHNLGVRNALHTAGVDGARTYPSLMPLFALDRIYYRRVRLRTARILRGYPWSSLSDHAAVYAEFDV